AAGHDPGRRLGSMARPARADPARRPLEPLDGSADEHPGRARPDADLPAGRVRPRPGFLGSDARLDGNSMLVPRPIRAGPPLWRRWAALPPGLSRDERGRFPAAATRLAGRGPGAGVREDSRRLLARRLVSGRAAAPRL